MHGEKEQNYWPGFVDALSNVVLTLVFVLVIFVFAIVMASGKVAEHVEQRIRSEMSEQDNALQAQRDRIQTTQYGMSRIEIDRANPEKMKSGAVAIESDHHGFILRYLTGIAEMDEKSIKRFDQDLLKKREILKGAHAVVLRSVVGSETYSIARRLAYYRAINVRNHLLSVFKVSPKDISVSIITPAKPEDGRVEIIFKKK